MLRRFHQRIVFILLFCCTSYLGAYSQTVPKKSFDSVLSLKDSLQKDTAKLIAARKLADSTHKAQMDSLSKSKASCDCVPVKGGKVEDGDWLLVLLPAILFLVLMIWLLNSKGLSEFSLNKAMSENAYPTIIEKNPEYTAANLAHTAFANKENLEEIIPPTIERTHITGSTTTGTPPNATTIYTLPDPNPSISRYIAFISTILTFVVALGVSCFYIYHYIRTQCPPDLSGISTLLIALGIGVMPYVFNKLSTAIGKNKAE